MGPKKKKRSESTWGPPIIFKNDPRANSGRLTLLDGARTERLTSSTYINALVARHDEPEPTEASKQEIANLEKEIELLEAQNEVAIASLEDATSPLQDEQFLPAGLCDHIERTVNAINDIQDKVDGRFSKLQNHCSSVERELRPSQSQHRQAMESLAKAQREHETQLLENKKESRDRHSAEMSRIREQHAEEIRQLIEDHEQVLTKKFSEHGKIIADMERAHVSLIDTKNDEHDKIVQKVRDDCETRTTHLEENRQEDAIKTLKDQVDDLMSSKQKLEAARSAEVKALKDQVDALTNSKQILEAVKSAEVKVLKDQIEKLDVSIADLIGSKKVLEVQLAREIREKDFAYSLDLKALEGQDLLMKKLERWISAYNTLSRQYDTMVGLLRNTLDHYYKVMVKLAEVAGYETPPKCH
ncbi:hypothetical protein FKW77_002355 [Venturia effusa]|uniref:Uncharacterized protein n=1 Tax=Venturia effusa TaxID=50376 RepID=A0A517LF00_9PEZI|nr:hypothetical protein FKW77_002355 [Venturia effusa]